MTSFGFDFMHRHGHWVSCFPHSHGA